MMTFREDCPCCGARVGTWMRGCNKCKAGDRLVDRLGKWCTRCCSRTNKDDKVICIHNNNFELRDKNGVNYGKGVL